MSGGATGGLAGARIEVIAPSGAHLSLEQFDRACAWFAAQGATLNCEVPRAGWQRFSDTDDARLEQIHRAARRDDVDAVMVVRGGYGLSRLLDRVDWALVAASARRGVKWIGYSDFTALQLGLLAKTGAPSFTGPALSWDFGRDAPDCPDPFTLAQLEALLRGEAPAVRWAPHDGDRAAIGAMPAAVEGRLWGGNLTMLASLAGTPFLPTVDGGILVLEDVGEHPYRIERMLHQLHYAGVLARQAAIVLGEFSDWKPAPHDAGYDLQAVVAYWRGHLGVPIVQGLPFGHGPRKAALGLGMRYALRASPAGVSLEALDAPPARAAAPRALHLTVRGLVQGVGFRHFVCSTADALGLEGWVRNRSDGSVEAVLLGEGAAIDAALERVRRGPRACRVDALLTREPAAGELGEVRKPFAALPTF